MYPLFNEFHYVFTIFEENPMKVDIINHIPTVAQRVVFRAMLSSHLLDDQKKSEILQHINQLYLNPNPLNPIMEVMKEKDSLVA